MTVVLYSTWDWLSSVLYANNPVPRAMALTKFQAILSFLKITPHADIYHKGIYTWTIFKHWFGPCKTFIKRALPTEKTNRS